MRIALVSREIFPFGGGGIGQFVASAARMLSEIAEVTVLTTSLFEPEYRALRAAGDERLVPASVRMVFVPEPTDEESSPWTHIMHVYGARVLETLRECYPDGAPDLIEFPDFLAEAFVALQARDSFDRFLAGTTICVRLHTTTEMCEVLDGCSRLDRWGRGLHAMERYGLRRADHIIHQGGDILGTYRRFYGDDALAPATRIAYPYHQPLIDPADDAEYLPHAPLRIVYAGRLERRKGVDALIKALAGSERTDFHLTLIGGDTDTAPLGGSMHDYLELAIAEDPRITLHGPAGRDELAGLIRAHDLVVVPSLWECWPYATLEALHLNRPVLGTPVGGLPEMLAEGGGWLARSASVDDLQEKLEELIAEPDAVGALIRAARPFQRGRELTSSAEILEGYRRLAADPSTPRVRLRARPGRAAPLVSAIVPYFRASAFVRDTVASLLAQTYVPIEVVLVNDGSFDPADELLEELVRGRVRLITQMNQGLGAARNFGILQSFGRYVLPLDADNCVAPNFVERCVEVLEQRPEVAYVTSWSRYIQPDGTPRPGPDLGYEPLGNQAALNEQENVAGDAAALLPRHLFDAGFAYSEELTSYEDWALYRQLAQAGMFGAIIPERLIRYRVRPDSMQAEVARPNHDRLLAEIDARIRERGMTWASSND